jgi:hypothetical protein
VTRFERAAIPHGGVWCRSEVAVDYQLRDVQGFNVRRVKFPFEISNHRLAAMVTS